MSASLLASIDPEVLPSQAEKIRFSEEAEEKEDQAGLLLAD